MVVLVILTFFQDKLTFFADIVFFFTFDRNFFFLIYLEFSHETISVIIAHNRAFNAVTFC